MDGGRARVCRQLRLTQSLTLAYHWQCSPLQLFPCQIYFEVSKSEFFFSVKKRPLYSNWTYWEAFLQSMGISGTHLLSATPCGGGLVAKSCPTIATPCTADHQAPLSLRFLRQEYWSGLPFSSLGDLPEPGIEPRSAALQGISDEQDMIFCSRRAQNSYNTSKAVVVIAALGQALTDQRGSYSSRQGVTVLSCCANSAICSDGPLSQHPTGVMFRREFSARSLENTDIFTETTLLCCP